MKIKSILSGISRKNALLAVLGALIQAVGLYNIHSVSNITEGGVLGLTLLLKHWFNISPAVSSFVLTLLCYIIGAGILGRNFVVYSLIACASYSVFYRICEHIPVIYPAIASMPLVASVLGAVFVGAGAGLCVRAGGAITGDDALAMGLSLKLKTKISVIYLASDLSVLALSLTYIDLTRILYSLLTVVLSGQIISFVSGERGKGK